MHAVRSACLVVVWLSMVPALTFAQTEIRVFVGGGITGPVKEAGAVSMRTSRNTFVYVSATEAGMTGHDPRLSSYSGA